VIRGFVNARHEAVVPIRVRGPGQSWLDVDAVVDSGFTGSLTLPVATAATLGLARQSGGSAVMADGTLRHFDIYAVEVAWESGWRPVLVSAVGAEALLGMRLLVGHELRIEAAPGGAVEIAPLP